ncbi:leucine-rich repeat-containing protein 15-like [Photinus pyralis]|uniref:LRRCT domain-containing protein n=1 Tax=Photinus pyralis TaxID=7054 RepID=A0A1Y1KDS2_PHOPY|nr:leucine-rich repeat-containing protein 15-like [Photinus pyralis]
MLKTCVLLLITFQNSLQCDTPTFDNTIVSVNDNEETISGCISPDTLKFKGDIIKISAINQNIPDLNEGAIRDISSAFEIVLAHNNIEIIRAEAFLNLPELQSIDLSGNKINWISENSFTNLPFLTKINLMSNEVSVSPRAFNNLPKLEEVNFAENKLESFDQGWFRQTPKLWWLWFRDNRLRTIPKAAFINLPSVRQIHFENNQIERIDKDAFKGLRNLQRIYFAQNQLKCFEINFHTPSKLVYMGVQFNNITFISSKVLETIQPNLLKFWVTGNPWQCACFDRLIDWGIKNHIDIAFKCVQQESVCVYPKQNPDECTERDDEEFYNEFSKNFGSEWICTPGNDY